MTRSKLGLVTIGQAPRTDLIPDVLPLLSEVDFAEYGALDPLGDAPDETVLAALAPKAGEFPLTSRLRSGAAVVMGQPSVDALLIDALRRAESDDVTAILLLCTGSFDYLSSTKPLLTAEELVHRRVAELAKNQQLGVLCPLDSQLDEWRQQWLTLVPAVHIAAADPYVDSDDVIAKAAKTLADQGSSILVMDCIGYSERMRIIAEHASGVPTILSRTLATRLAVEIVAKLSLGC